MFYQRLVVVGSRVREFRRNVVIRELPDGRWMNETLGSRHKHPMTAVRNQNRYDAWLVEKGDYDVVNTWVEWRPLTDQGLEILSSLHMNVG